MPSLVVVGAQWGDEGKGKIVDLLAEHADLVVRFAGGSNAGHTLVVEGRRLVLHLVPSGILHQRVICLLGDGMVIDPGALLHELDELRAAGVAVGPERIRVSRRAHLVLPYHRMLDDLREERPGALGTTRRGIGPAYEDKAGRRGVRAGDLVDRERLARRLGAALDDANGRIERLGGHPLELSTLLPELTEQARRLAPYLDDTAAHLQRGLAAGRRVLLEGAQGALLDIDQGTYPFVTSSTTLPGGACAGAGLGPAQIGAVVGVAKAYATRVGAGPFPSEMPAEIGERVRRTGHEFGATTGRPRRCGFLDLPALRHAARLCGLSSLALTKLDVLAGLDPLTVCTGYRSRSGEAIAELPSDADDLDAVEPILESLPGFEGDLSSARRLEDLPAAARGYLDRIEREVGVPLSLVSLGPGRQETLQRFDPWGGPGR
jgi:adenylosuccinate synthase